MRRIPVISAMGFPGCKSVELVAPPAPRFSGPPLQATAVCFDTADPAQRLEYETAIRDALRPYQPRSASCAELAQQAVDPSARGLAAAMSKARLDSALWIAPLPQARTIAMEAAGRLAAEGVLRERIR